MLMAQGTPTEVYALVAHGALRCWFGADGPLKATHIFHADAASPTEGGAAEIVLHVRDGTFSDQRGARAFRVSMRSDGGSVRVGITNLKMPEAMGQAMRNDVETWARGGEGCQARALGATAPKPATPARPPARVTGAGQP
jgi:hypothetical protein